MCMEMLTNAAAEQEAETFAAAHPLGSFMQSPRWAQVKQNWTHHTLVSRGSDGRVRGSMLVLALADRGDGSSLLYAPRGPVCDFARPEAASDLVSGVRQLAGQYGHGEFKCDPLIFAGDEAAIRTLTDLGLRYTQAEGVYRTVQPWQNAVRRGLSGMSTKNLMDSFDSRTRRRIQASAQQGVICRVGTQADLPAFYAVYREMGRRKDMPMRPQAYFAQMLAAFGDDARLYLCCQGETVLAGAIAVAFGGRVSYVYGASDHSQPQLAVGYRLQWAMLNFALERGCDVYDLGGICTDQALCPPLYDLYRFKRNFAQVENTAGEFGFCF